MEPRCTTHVDPRDWKDTKDPDRPGWLITRCLKCGAWIGNRPVDGKAK